MAEGTQYGMAGSHAPQDFQDFQIQAHPMVRSEPRSPAILDAIESLSAAIDRVHAGQEATENAIAKILRPSGPGLATPVESRDLAENSELAARLYHLAEALEHLHRRQTDTLNRIEI